MRSIVSKLKLLIKGSGISQVTRVIWYTINKWHFDREYKKNIIHDIHKAEKVAPGRLLEMAWIVQGVRVDFENASLEVRFLASDMVRISWEPGESPVHYALCKLDWPQIHINYQTSNDGIGAESKDVRISVSTNGCIHFIKPDGVILHTELPPCFTVTPLGPFWIASSTLQSDECLFGLGEHTGKINLVGSTHRFWNQDPGGAYKQGFDPIYMPIPVYLGLHNNGSYLIFHENYHPSTFTSNHDPIEKFEEQVRFSFEGGRLQYYFIPGPPSRALARFTELTGRPSLPPIWSLGYHQSRWGYKTQAEILEIARGFQAHDIPV